MTKLVCFDLDDTLIKEMHSVMFLCLLNGQLNQLMEIERKEDSGELQWIEADYHKAALIQGLNERDLLKHFLKIMKPLNHIGETVACLKKRNIQSIVITAGPVQVARIAAELWRLDASYGSDYEIVDGVFTGRILEHLGDKGKVPCLRQYCRLNGILPHECIAVGDGATDIPLFEYCGKSIALNASHAAIKKATQSINTDSLLDILSFI